MSVFPNTVFYLNDEPCETLQIPDNIEIIEDEAFFYCSNLRTVNLGKNVKSIGKNAFQGCGSLLSIECPCFDFGYFVTEANVFYGRAPLKPSVNLLTMEFNRSLLAG